MLRHITGVTIFSVRLYGGSSRISAEGGSVARANAPHVSIIKLTQSIYTEVRGGSETTTPPRNTINMATQFTVSWNCKNLRTFV